MVRSKISFLVGNGQRVIFWKDTGIGIFLCVCLSCPCFALANECYGGVGDGYLGFHGGGWDGRMEPLFL